MVNKESTSVLELDIEKLYPDPMQPRSYLGDLSDLVRSIKRYGVIEPLVVRPSMVDGEFVIIAGERRYRAAKLAGLKRLPVVVKDVADDKAMEISLVENLHRKDLDPFEEAEGYEILRERFGYTHDEIARAVGKARSTISETISLLRIPPEIREEAYKRGIRNRSVLVEIAKLPSKKEMLDLLKKITQNNLSRSEVRKIVRQRKARKFCTVEFVSDNKDIKVALMFRNPEDEKVKKIADFLRKILELE